MGYVGGDALADGAMIFKRQNTFVAQSDAQHPVDPVRADGSFTLIKLRYEVCRCYADVSSSDDTNFDFLIQLGSETQHRVNDRLDPIVLIRLGGSAVFGLFEYCKKVVFEAGELREVCGKRIGHLAQEWVVLFHEEGLVKSAKVNFNQAVGSHFHLHGELGTRECNVVNQLLEKS